MLLGITLLNLIGQLEPCAVYKTHDRRAAAEPVGARRAAPRSAQASPRREHLLLRSKWTEEEWVSLHLAVSI